MPNIRKPRKGSMQYWPRVRAKRPYARIRSWSLKKGDKGLLGFAGYKVGMTHLILSDTRKTSITKGLDISRPATIVECPPLKIAGIRYYTKKGYGLAVATEVLAPLDKEVGRKICLPKKTINTGFDKIKPEEYADIRVLVHTQPKLTDKSNKKPEIFEIGLGGSLQEKFDFAKEHFGKEVSVDQVFKEGQQIDIHAITIGKGNQGPVKRFGIALRAKKSEKTKRGPGSLGGWKAHAHFMYRVAHAGQMGYHQREELNKKIMKIGNDPSIINPKGGFRRYPLVKNAYMLIEGSIAGPSKRIVQMTVATRKSKKISPEVLPILEIAIKNK